MPYKSIKSRDSKMTVGQKVKAILNKAAGSQQVRRMNTSIPRTVASRYNRAPTTEIKCIDFAWNSATPAGAALALNTTGSIIVLNGLQAGSGVFNRIGNKIHMKSIKLDFTISPIAAARTCPTDVSRVMIIYDKQSNGALPAMADIIANVDQTGVLATGSNPLASLNIQNRDRFEVIMDKRIMQPNITIAAGGVPTAFFPDAPPDDRMVSEYRKLNNRLVTYGTTTGLIGDIKSGSLLLVTFGGLAANSEAFTMAYWNARLRYFDV